MSNTLKLADRKPQSFGKTANTTRLETVLTGCFRAEIEAADFAGPDNALLMPPVAHPLIETIQLAYSYHRPLVLSPDAVWLTIAQGLAKHINKHAEEVRDRFVDFEGKKDLKVQRDEFRRGSTDNNWPGVFEEFSAQLADYLGKKRDLLVSGFSTTGPIERAASEVVLLDAMQSYFRYTLMTCCGIPRVTLAGEPRDWIDIDTRVRAVADLIPELEWWTAPLIEVTEQLCQAAVGKVNEQFWATIYDERSGSGVTRVSGWASTFYPYIGKGKYMRPNPALGSSSSGRSSKPDYADFIFDIPSAPFEWDYFGNVLKMRFVGGLVGTVEQVDNEGALVPAVGWAVIEEPEEAPS